MPTTIPALRGKFGETEYYLTTMKVGELVKTIRLPRDLPGWEGLSIEERYQRDINITRVKKGITQYFAMDKDRFSGSLVLAVLNHNDIVFETLDNFGGGAGAQMFPLYTKVLPKTWDS